MPKKYHIQTKKTPSRYLPVPRLVAFERDGCLGCLHCVKRSSCVYDAYRGHGLDPRRVEDPLDARCLGCMRCVQECKKGVLVRAKNPEVDRIGDDYWGAGLIQSLWRQAESGAIPVSGCGYQGPFTGPGWDGMWTDMSEIVRPTRDGIHGREYISTSVDLGGKPDGFAFGGDGGGLDDAQFRLREVPLPIVLEIPRIGPKADNLRVAAARAAKRLGTLLVADAAEAVGLLHPSLDRLILRLDPKAPAPPDWVLRRVPVVELPWSGQATKQAARLRAGHPALIVSVRLPLDPPAPARAARLAADGAVDVLHLEADERGRGAGRWAGRHVRDMLRDVHLALVERGIRDRVTLIVRGGIAMAEHVAKAVACGADAVGIGTPLQVALECRVCPQRPKGCDPCPVHLADVDPDWGERRIVNVMGSWHSQLLEVLGAMGLREVRRLRGEVGRVLFFEDLERDCFGPVFGTRKAAEGARA